MTISSTLPSQGTLSYDDYYEKTLGSVVLLHLVWYCWLAFCRAACQVGKPSPLLCSLECTGYAHRYISICLLNILLYVRCDTGMMINYMFENIRIIWYML